LTISLEEEEVNRDILGRQEQGGGLGKIWNRRKLREGSFKNKTYKSSEWGIF
jgi:hypothetical protein